MRQGSAAPPMLARQHASRFSFPPDRFHEGGYIHLSPCEFVEHAGQVLGESLNVLQVCEVFANGADSSPAYRLYISRWRSEVEAVLSLGVVHIAHRAPTSR